MNSSRHSLGLATLSLRMRLAAVSLFGLAVFGCSGSQGTAGTAETSHADTACFGCTGVEVELKQAAMASVDPALNVTAVRLQTDQDTATAMFGVDYKGVPIAGLSLRTRQGKALATSQVEFSEEAKGVSEVPSLDADAAATRALELRGEDANVVDVQLVFLPTTKDAFTATSAVRRIESLRLTWVVRLEDQAGPDSLPQIFSLYIDAQEGSLIGSHQEGLHVKGVGHSYHSQDVTIEVTETADRGNYVLIDAAQGGRQTYSAASATNLNLTVPVISGSLEFGNGDRPDDFDEAFAGGKLTDEGMTSAVDLHYGIGQAWDFFAQSYGRNGPYNDGTPVDGVANVACPSSQDIVGLYVPSMKRIYSCLPLVDPSDWGALEGTHPEVVTHEFAHAVFVSELGLATPVPSDHAVEYESLAEALAQIFSLVENSKRVTLLLGHLWDDTASGFWVGADGMGWSPSSSDTHSMDYYCQSATLFCPKTVATVVSEGTTGHKWPYRVGGIIRQLFWYLSDGVSPLSNPTLYGSHSGTSYFLPGTRGFSGLGVKRAAELFYNAAVYSSVAYPNFLEFGNMLIQRAGDEAGQCSEKQKKVVDALAAVKILNEPSDRDAPTIDLGVKQHGGVVEVTVDAVDPLGDSPQAPHTIGRVSVKLDGTEVAQPTLNASGHGVANLPVGLFHNGPAASYTFLVEVEDGCKNTATKSVVRTVYLNRNLVVQQSGLPKQPRLTATLSDGGSLALVQFSADNGPLSTVTGPAPFEKVFDTSTWTDGSHSIFVSGQDAQGNIFETTHTVIADNTPPTVTSFTSSGANPPFTLTATATDVSPLTQAAFSVQGTLLPFATDTTAPYNASYTPMDNSPHTLKVGIKDSYGNEGVGTLAAPLDTTPPTVTLSGGQTTASTVVLNAMASDTCGFTSMNLSLSGLVTGTGTLTATPNNPSDTTLTWNYTISTSTFLPGMHLLTADTTDRCGNTSHQEYSFLVVTGPPTVTIDPVQMDPAHPKRPKIKVRVLHPRPIKRIEVWRTQGVGQTLLSLGTWTSASGETNPIQEFTLNTSDVSWNTGDRDIRVFAYDDLNFSGSETTKVYADNSAPNITDIVWQPLDDTTVSWDFKAEDTVASIAIPSGDNMKEMSALILSVSVSPFIHNMPPWRMSGIMGVGNGASTQSLIIYATDKFGNVRSVGLKVNKTCTQTTQVWHCTFNSFETIPTGVSEHEDP